MDIVLQILTLLGSLAMFLYGMSQMSGGLQKMAGNRMRTFMAKMTSNETGSFYMDLINTLEKMGDFIINISQSVLEAKTV